jgi:hypothetical protein
MLVGDSTDTQRWQRDPLLDAGYMLGMCSAFTLVSIIDHIRLWPQNLPNVRHILYMPHLGQF